MVWKLSDAKCSSPAVLARQAAGAGGGPRRGGAGPGRPAGLLVYQPPTERPGWVGVIYGAIDPGRDKKSPCCPARAAAAGNKLRVAAAHTAVLLLQQNYNCGQNTQHSCIYISVCVCVCECVCAVTVTTSFHFVVWPSFVQVEMNHLVIVDVKRWKLSEEVKGQRSSSESSCEGGTTVW